MFYMVEWCVVLGDIGIIECKIKVYIISLIEDCQMGCWFCKLILGRLDMGFLVGVKVVEFVGIGLGLFCVMLLFDMGVDVICIDCKGGCSGGKYDIVSCGKCLVVLDLKKLEVIEVCLKFIEKVDILMEGFWLGVMEWLGLGFEVCFECNLKFVYGCMMGWGQIGFFNQVVGYDINYILLVGVLYVIGWKDVNLVLLLNLVGDFGGGVFYFVFGFVVVFFELEWFGKGQVVDVVMIDGVVFLMVMFYGMKVLGVWMDIKGENFFDGGVYFYDLYEIFDGKWILLGLIEFQFYVLL